VLVPPVEIASGPGTPCAAIALGAAAGTRAFASAAGRVRILDVDPASPAYEAVVAERPIAGEVSQLKVVPGGSRLYVAARRCSARPRLDGRRVRVRLGLPGSERLHRPRGARPANPPP
jgi:hypothetical protein